MQSICHDLPRAVFTKSIRSITALARPCIIMIELEVQDCHDRDRFEVVVPFEFTCISFRLMFTNKCLPGMSPLLNYRIARIKDCTLPEMLLISFLHFDDQSLAVFTFARNIENRHLVFIGQSDVFRRYELNILDLIFLHDHVQKSDQHILILLTAKQSLEHEITQ